MSATIAASSDSGSGSGLGTFIIILLAAAVLFAIVSSSLSSKEDAADPEKNKCSNCGATMVYIGGQEPYWHCPNCKTNIYEY